MQIIYDAEGMPRQVNHLLAVNGLFKLKEKSGSNPWPVIEKCLEIWKDTHPLEWESFLVEIDKTKQTRKEKKYASTYDKVHGGYLRYTLDIPTKLIKMIRCIYGPDELPMRREFFLEWAKKFPKMKIAEKL